MNTFQFFAALRTPSAMPGAKSLPSFAAPKTSSVTSCAKAFQKGS